MYKVNNCGYLITSYADQINVQRQCEELGIWLIPKSLVSEISLEKNRGQAFI
jgi:hypothetical protein